jgi:hypothetical protein
MNLFSLFFGKKAGAKKSTVEAIAEPVRTEAPDTYRVIEASAIIDPAPTAERIKEPIADEPIASSIGETTESLTVNVDGDQLSLSDGSFSGLALASPSGTWLLAWARAEASSGASAEEGDCIEYLIYDQTTRKTQARGRICGDIGIASIADNGSIAYWENAQSGESESLFTVLTCDGVPLLKLAAGGRMFNGALSPSGRLAVRQLSLGPTVDSNMLQLVDVQSGQVLFSTEPQTRWADGYRIDESLGQLMVLIGDVGEFRYDFNGRFLDQLPNFTCDALNSDKYSLIIQAADTLVNSYYTSQEQAAEVVVAVTRARALGADKDPSWNPQALKILGLAHDLLGDFPRALACLEQAVELKPKLGVKRKISELRAKLS